MYLPSSALACAFPIFSSNGFASAGGGAAATGVGAAPTAPAPCPVCAPPPEALA